MLNDDERVLAAGFGAVGFSIDMSKKNDPKETELAKYPLEWAPSIKDENKVVHLSRFKIIKVRFCLFDELRIEI